MKNTLTYKVEKDYEELKIRDYLKDVESLSGRFVRGAGRSGRISVNGNKVRLSYMVKKGDVIKVNVEKEEDQNIIPEKMDIEVIYEDMDLIVVNKRPGMVVHPTKSHPTGTLSNGIINYFREKGENCIVRLVSRLDMDTSGLIIVAKNQFSHMALARDMQDNKVEKGYKAIIHGNMDEKRGTIDLPIGRPTLDSIKRTVMEDGQRSITHYEVEESFEQGELVKLNLETGRTHQIRVHLSHLGHPIFGDSLYGKEETDYIERQALHAYKLVFPHPKSGEEISLECGLPQDMNDLIHKLNGEE